MVGSGIRKKTYSGSQIQGSKRHRIPDPDPQHWMILKNKYKIYAYLSRQHWLKGYLTCVQVWLTQVLWDALHAVWKDSVWQLAHLPSNYLNTFLRDSKNSLKAGQEISIGIPGTNKIKIIYNRDTLSAGKSLSNSDLDPKMLMMDQGFWSI